MDRSRPPVGIKVICAIWALLAILNLVQVAQILAVVPLSNGILLSMSLITSLSAGYLIVSYGLWKTYSWAWKGAIGLVIVGGGSALVEGVSGAPLFLLMTLVGIYLVLRRESFLTVPSAG